MKTLFDKINYEKKRMVGINTEAWSAIQRVEEDVKEFIREDYKNTVLAKRGEISWQEYARRRIKLAGKELL